jgi:hypothetical protein
MLGQWVESKRLRAYAASPSHQAGARRSAPVAPANLAASPATAPNSDRGRGHACRVPWEVGKEHVVETLRDYESRRLLPTARVQASATNNKARFHFPDGPGQVARDSEMAERHGQKN